MDIDLFRDGEHFSTFASQDFLNIYPEDSTSLDGINNDYEWNLDHEREINGDLALIPVSNGFVESILDNSPPLKEDFHKLMADWQQFINIDNAIPDFPINDPIIEPEENQDEMAQQKESSFDPLDIPNTKNFDITKFINEDPEEIPQRKPKAGVKKIDLKAQRYIVSEDEDEVDIETVSECGNSPVLEAGDLNSLLEQFEATELPELTQAQPEQMEVEVEGKKQSHIAEPTTSYCESSKNKMILESLPEELIKRIKESGKRKPISVIPPIPNKKRGKAQEAQVKSKVSKVVHSEAVQLDHDYCSTISPYPKHPKKDSGFESSEEDNAVLKNQPVVKNADGTLMVSLLKINSHKDNVQKKRLNLEEYKRRREGVLKVMQSKPSEQKSKEEEQEDERVRLLKHQEKLKQMAKEVLNTPPKAEKKSIVTGPEQKAVSVTVPVDMEMKTVVSMGVNTDQVIGEEQLAPIEQLEEIKPILQKASDKINSNSLITSLLENIPKLISKNKPVPEAVKDVKKEHGEDKTILFLPKNRSAVKTRSVEVQTNISLVKESRRRYRRRSSSSSSSERSRSRSSSRFSRKRKSSDSSSGRSSRSSSRSSKSSYSVRSSSRSRSRSFSPRNSRRSNPSREREFLREVEERRVIYVGRIGGSTTREDLRKRFGKFGPITNVSIHFREHGDNYGFVTFANKLDAFEAIEHGNDDPFLPKYDLSFGGRRIFCQTNYSDLDNMQEDPGYYPSRPENSFDALLREAQEKLRKRKI